MQTQIELVARIICAKINNIEPVDSLDGSQNWWMFNKQAEELLRTHPHIGEGLVNARADLRAAVEKIKFIETEIAQQVKPIKRASGETVDAPS